MNLDMIRPKNETEDLLLSLTEICGTISKQTHTKAQESLELKMIHPRETFSFRPSISIDGSWMLGLTNLDVYKSILNKTEENNNFKLYIDTFDDLSFAEVKDEFEVILAF